MQEYPYRTCVEIDLNKLQRNLQRLRCLIGPDCKIMEVLKADAYGHGLRLCARYAAPYVDWFAAATLEEALTIREEAPQTPILILGRLLDHELCTAARQRLTINVFSLAYARHVQDRMAAEGLEIDCQLKIDTGMNRLGLRARVGSTDQAVAEAREIFALERLHVTGIYTHFACADTDDPSDQAFSNGQFAAFEEVCRVLRAQGLDVGLCHCASTGGLICYPQFRLGMVRSGMFALGQSISEASAAELGLEPILTWYAKVIDIRTVPAGESISYGRTYHTKTTQQIAVISAGYADGYSRAFTNHTQVILDGQMAPVRGKPCMDFIMVDITGIQGVQVGDQAVLLGRDGDHWISSDTLAQWVPYETNGGITTAITPRVRRVYRYNGETVAVSAPVY